MYVDTKQDLDLHYFQYSVDWGIYYPPVLSLVHILQVYTHILSYLNLYSIRS
jgi:hypothetical protein